MPPCLVSPLAKFLLVAAILGGLAWGIASGVKAIDANGYTRAESKYKLQIADADKARADEVQRADKETAQKRVDEARNILRLSEQLITAGTTIDTLTKHLQERVSNVSTQYRPHPDAGLLPVPGWVITHGWVCDYNRAIGYAMSGTDAAVSGDEDPSCTADPFSRSAVTAERILVHHEDYAAYCRKLEEQVSVLLNHIDFVERNQSK